MCLFVPRPLTLILAFVLSATLYACPAFAVPGDVALATPNVACPKAQVGDDQLQSKYDEMWNLYATAIQREAKAVENEIARLYDEAKGAGNLDLVLFWEGLKKLFADAGTVVWQPTTQKKDWGRRFQGAEFPSDFTAILRKCEEGYGDAKNELEAGYRLLIAELTKRGKVAEAQAVKSEVAGLWTREAEPQPKPVAPEQTAKPRPGPQKAEPQKPLLERMAGKWGHPNSAVIVECDATGRYRQVFKANGAVHFESTLRVIDETQLEVKVPQTAEVYRYRLVDDWLVMRAFKPDGTEIAEGFVKVRVK